MVFLEMRPKLGRIYFLCRRFLMPKVRQRDPNDKVKTKGKKHSKNRKKQTNVSRQMQAAVEQKVRQKQEQQASNEAATTTTEQAVVETIAGAAQLAGKTSGVIYDKVIRQQIPEDTPQCGFYDR